VGGAYGAEVDGSANNAQLLSQTFSTPSGTAKVAFSWFIEDGLDAGEYLAFDVSKNGGAWTELARLRGNQDPENVWHSPSFTVASVSTLRLRYRGTMSVSTEDAFVDAVLVTNE
jgi:hypothetical protein